MNKRDLKWGYVLISPYVVSLIVFSLIPLVCLAYFSFAEYDLFNPPTWVGLDNYKDVLTNVDTWRAFRNVGLFALVYIPLNVGGACVLGVALNTKLKGIGVFRTIYFLPSLMPWVAVSMIFTMLFNPVYGSVNFLLQSMGIGPFEFHLSQNWVEVITTIAVVTVWKGLGYASLYVVAGLQNISEDVMEAAEVDGAGVFTKFFKITIPLITPTIFMLLLFALSTSLQAFDAFLVMIGSGGVTSTEFTVINTLIYHEAFEASKVGIASAICWIALFAAFMVTLIQKWSEKKWVHYE